MIVQESSSLVEFGELALESLVPWPAECAGAFFWGYVEPGYSNFTHRFYSTEGEPFLLEDPEPSWDAIDALLDIPDDVDPERADVAAVIVTYRVSDASWVARVAFEDEAIRLQPGPLLEDGLAREFCPLV